MSVALELRVPMLDETVRVRADLAAPAQGLRLHGKLVLRKIAEGWLPKEVARKTKMGFGCRWTAGWTGIFGNVSATAPRF